MSRMSHREIDQAYQDDYTEQDMEREAESYEPINFLMAEIEPEDLMGFPETVADFYPNNPMWGDADHE